VEARLVGCGAFCVQQSPTDRLQRRLPGAGPTPEEVLAARVNKPPLPNLEVLENCREAASRRLAGDRRGCQISALRAVQETLPSSSSRARLPVLIMSSRAGLQTFLESAAARRPPCVHYEFMQ